MSTSTSTESPFTICSFIESVKGAGTPRLNATIDRLINGIYECVSNKTLNPYLGNEVCVTAGEYRFYLYFEIGYTLEGDTIIRFDKLVFMDFPGMHTSASQVMFILANCIPDSVLEIEVLGTNKTLLVQPE